MCGIAGEIRFDGTPVDQNELVSRIHTLAHRGPDGEGVWVHGPVGLAHRRLAIIDTTDRGRQPMTNAAGTLCLTFNGEIYNYQELRRELESSGVRFVSDSDSEVLIHLYERDQEKMLKRLRGMFAFAIWDETRQMLFFARDRIGKKPFYYSIDERNFLFASELKALLLNRKPEIDRLAIRTFLGLQYVPAPQTGFAGLCALPPGHFGTVKQHTLSLSSYDRIERVPKFDGDFIQAAKHIRQLMEDAVRLRLVADVPVGAFLSGGIDSSIVTALAARASSHPLQTFTMGFSEFGFDERAQARAFAATLGTRHEEFEAKAGEIASLVDMISSLYDAPYADSSSLPTWLLAKETSRHVKVVLAGDGGDELFGGYRRYQYFLRAIQLPKFFTSMPVLRAVKSFVRRNPKVMRFIRTAKGARESFAEGYASLFAGSYFSEEELSLLLKPDFFIDTERASAEQFIRSHYQNELGAEGALAFDLNSYLPDDLNVKMDRATMAHGLEARAPFLDQELASFAARLPMSFLVTPHESKRILYEAFKDLIPPEIFHRPKRGFQVPLGAWFRTDLRSLFIDRCLSSSAKLALFCEPRMIRRYLLENDRGRDHGNRLWMLLMLETWLEAHS
ncbi:MAG TPA: asparagine synthase (glutamine-hydrolyzing) [Patescibacteria group bacterium]|nr:asparagine synthase (glutamine-hydrolyzing) [Patescibacteria group bacterium]